MHTGLPLLVTLVVLTCLLGLGNSGNSTTVSVKEGEHPPPSKCSGKAANRKKCRLIKVDNVYHVGLIEVGTPPQNIIVIFDTGSTDLWVTASAYCKSHPSFCHSHATYNHDKSSTFDKTFKTKKWKTEYIDGEVNGFTAKDTVTLGDLTVKGQIFAEAHEMKTDGKVSTLTDDKSAGVFGLGLRSYSDIGTEPPFVNMIKNKIVDKPVFSFYFDRLDQYSHIHFGSVDEGYFHPPLVYTHVHGSTHWEIEIDMIVVNNKTLAKNVRAVVDSGSSHIVGKAHLMDAIHKGVVEANDMGMYYLGCKVAKDLPTVMFVIEKKIFAMSPADYVTKKGGQCESGFTTVDEVPKLVLGTVWMTKFYTVFEMSKKPRIGFAVSKQRMMG